MKKITKQSPWKVISQIVRVESPWLKIIAENLLDNEGKKLEYWRVEKPDGFLIITIQNGKIILPNQMYRPGVGEFTLDFCGGRLTAGLSAEQNIVSIVRRELSIKSDHPLEKWSYINKTAWALDSSFSSARTTGVVAELKPDAYVKAENICASYGMNKSGFDKLLKDLLCIQCRAVMLEWMYQLDIK